MYVYKTHFITFREIALCISKFYSLFYVIKNININKLYDISCIILTEVVPIF